MQSMNPTNIDFFLDQARKIAANEQHAPIAVIASDTEILPILAVFRDDSDKDRFVQAAQAASRRMNAHTAVFVTEAWATVLPKDTYGVVSDEEAGELLQKARAAGVQRREILIVTIEVRGEAPAVFTAEIGAEEGFGDRKIGPWEKMDAEIVTGRMMDLLGEVAGKQREVA